ncbi:MAG: four helix bundle protein [Merismopedia sp. SIO2A8]|nr:four helix bundle protein [Symploca sp. SIO2B6]NET51413.1 four helix bundle protein [Merismopedia sp. SIO2A8]
MGRPDFENLQIYKLSEKLANEIWVIVKEWEYFAQDTVGKQIVRSADSVGANIAEGNGRYNIRDNQRFIKIAKGSLYETIHWLRLAYYRQLMTDKQVQKLKPILDELSPKLSAYLNSLNKEKTQ